MLTWKTVTVILSEVACSFFLVFSLAFFWSADKDHRSSTHSGASDISVNGKGVSEGLRYNPARRKAQVTDDVARVFQKPSEDSEILDEIPFGSSIDINGWDTGRKFIKVALPRGGDGFVSVRSLAYESSVDSMMVSDRQLKKATVYQRQLLKYFSFNNLASSRLYLTLDGPSNGFEASESLTHFVNTIQKNRSESSFDFEKVDFALLAWDENGSGRLVYPAVSEFITRIRQAGVGIRMSRIEAPHSGDSTTRLSPFNTNNIGVSLTQELPIAIVSPELSRQSLALKSLTLSCFNLSCQLAVVQMPDVAKFSLGAIFLKAASNPNATMKIAEYDEASPYGIFFVNFDGDVHDDLAIFTSKSPTKLSSEDITYVALNDHGLWRLVYARDHTSNGVDGIRWSPEPGQYDGTIAVKVYSEMGQPIAYSLDGSDPSCKPTTHSVVFSEAQVLVEKSTAIKAKVCGSLSEPEAVVLANYEILSSDAK